MKHTDKIQKVECALLNVLVVPETDRQLHVLQRRKVREQVAGVVLPHETDRIFLVIHKLALGQLEQVLAVDVQFAGAGTVKTADHV